MVRMTRPTAIAHDCGGGVVLMLLALSVLAWVPIAVLLWDLLRRTPA